MLQWCFDNQRVKMYAELWIYFSVSGISREKHESSFILKWNNFFNEPVSLPRLLLRTFFQNSSHISSLCDCCPKRNTFALILKELMPNLTSCWCFRPVKHFTVVAWNNWVIAMGYYPIGGRKNKPLKMPRKDTLRVVLIYIKLDFSFKSLKQMYIYF